MNKHKEWFEEWFDTPYYHILYRERDNKEAAAFIDNLFNFLKMEKGQSVLDLACGKGRHSIYLSQKGLNVVGADLSVRNIELASKFETSNLKFKVHDMRKEIRNSYYDYILNLFTSFGYFNSDEENIQTLKSVFAGLKNGGEFIIDFLNVQKLKDMDGLSETKVIDELEFKIHREIKDGFIYKNIKLLDGDKTHIYQERVMAISKADFEMYFKEIGFRVIDVFGDYELNNFTIETSDRLIYRLKKE